MTFVSEVARKPSLSNELLPLDCAAKLNNCVFISLDGDVETNMAYLGSYMYVGLDALLIIEYCHSTCISGYGMTFCTTPSHQG